MKICRCENCGEYYQGIYCSNCGTKNDVTESQQPEIVVTISEPNSLNNESIRTDYSIKPEDLAVPVELLKSFLEDTDPHAVSMRGVLIHAKTDEQKVWSGRPNPFVVILIVFKWLPTVILTFVFLTIIKLGYIWGIILLFYAVVDVALNSFAIGFMALLVWL